MRQGSSPGCSQLLPTRLSAWTSRRAIAQAIAGGVPRGVDFRVANAMEFDVVAEGPWDLIVMSETVPYLGWRYPLFDVAWMATQLHEAMPEGARLLMADLSGGVRDHLQQPWVDSNLS